MKEILRAEIEDTVKVLGESRRLMLRLLPRVEAELGKTAHPGVFMDVLERLSTVAATLGRVVVDASKLLKEEDVSIDELIK